MPTDNHDLYIPEHGSWENEWEIPANANYKDIDAVLEIRDTLANRPDPANESIPDGTKFIVDDPTSDLDGERFVFRADDNTWYKRPAMFSSVGGVATSTKHYIRSGEFGRIPTDYVTTVPDSMEIDGTLELDGKLEII